MLMVFKDNQVCDCCGKLTNVTTQSVLDSNKNLCHTCCLKEMQSSEYEQTVSDKLKKSA